MRISDWSSDVCSSDLLVRRLLLGVDQDHVGAGRLVGRRPGQSLGLAEPGDQRLAAGDHQEVGVAPGRAGRLDLALELLDPQQVLARSEEHTSELQSLMRISYAVFCLKKKKTSN